MAALISGKAVSAQIRQKLKDEIKQMRETIQPNFCPGLVIVQVGDQADSNVYIRMKLKAAEEIGIKANHLKLSRYNQFSNYFLATFALTLSFCLGLLIISFVCYCCHHLYFEDQ